MALDTVDTSSLKMEEEMEKIKAAELLKQFKLDMQGTNTSTINTNITEVTNTDILQNKDKTL
jgi:hypothetical protein